MCCTSDGEVAATADDMADGKLLWLELGMFELDGLPASAVESLGKCTVRASSRTARARPGCTATEGKKKALTEVKNGGNTRRLAMVLRSERELLTQSKEQEDEIAALRLQLEQKDREVERLKDLCLRQRDEIRALKNAVLFPDSQPDRHLREEISTLTGHIQCLAEELAQVKTEKHTARSCFDDEYCSSPRTPVLNEETAYSLECSIGEAETPNYGSPDEMFVKDLNPCLTPCISKSKSEEYEESISSHRSSSKARPDLSCSSRGRPMSKSSDHHKPTSGSTNGKRRVYRSDQDKIYQNLF